MKNLVVSACQNKYQEERVLNSTNDFLNKNFYFLNLHFDLFHWSPRYFDKAELNEETLRSYFNILKKGNLDLYIIQGSMHCPPMSLKKGGNDMRLLGIYFADILVNTQEINYFKINHTGKYVGKAKKVKREKIFSLEFEKDEIFNSWLNKLNKTYS